MNRYLGQDLPDAVLRHGDFPNDDTGEQERLLVDQIEDVVALVDPWVGHDAMWVCADGGFDVVLGCGEDAGKGKGGGDVLGPDEEGVMVCVWGFGEGVEGEVEAGFVAHGCSC